MYVNIVDYFTHAPISPIQAEAEKQASLTVLEKKILPMEDLFSEFQAWLSTSEVSLISLSPPSSNAEERKDQLSNSNVSAICLYSCACVLICFTICFASFS